MTKRQKSFTFHFLKKAKAFIISLRVKFWDLFLFPCEYFWWGNVSVLHQSKTCIRKSIPNADLHRRFVNLGLATQFSPFKDEIKLHQQWKWSTVLGFVSVFQWYIFFPILGMGDFLRPASSRSPAVMCSSEQAAISAAPASPSCKIHTHAALHTPHWVDQGTSSSEPAQSGTNTKPKEAM